ncbi:hypothetical protein [Candidatus Chromulinivorax destructor]|uniref:Uncharacterized protein n=1 Tax=Candidatus Chromulinivorax destructor TaxID=2066483 RepID=A0A345ZA46_9BACT|nr:hypothetical protein [Candidatus Chromulinivorax destructor]AXK60163.1 hypothetical protein C0J27_00155 [Candidatus Chromulinivorax destructor]
MHYTKKIISLLTFSVGLCFLTTNINAHPFSFLWICSASSSKVEVYDPSRMNLYDFCYESTDVKKPSEKGTVSTSGSIQSTPNPSADGLYKLNLPQPASNEMDEFPSSPFSPRSKKTNNQVSPARRRLRDQSIHHIPVNSTTSIQSQDLRRMALGHAAYKYKPADTTYIN